ncbi:TRAP transporter substrate-binding protein DctP [Falsiroseomonas bella]|uniref:TRAP transporter substrate-binding protein DctP n=1 Tax=Falsiroseomonas bella TaxID=2184016 RepID=A0A317FEM5_9PROT|nr:DctP family TRAP transporter solute-binding subunit [Falsiroseomonas bella]PWS37510.1 TRAP transporter substrate-binding protein DctP [Falsiroseomonas bella]
MTIRRRAILAGAALGALAAPTTLRAQATVVRWGDLLPANHPQVLMIERIAAELRDKTSGRIQIQAFPGGQLGSGRDMMEAVSAGALQFTTDGAGALGAFLPALTLFEAPYLWRDAAHLAKASGTPVFGRMNDELVSRRGMRMLNVTYYGKRHLTAGSRQVRSPADMQGFRLRVPPVDVFRAMAEAWGARATPIAFPELYLALSQGAVDGQENPLPTIQSAKLFEVQKFLVLTEHIITPRIIIVNDAFWRGLRAPDRDAMQAAFASAAAWQDQELLAQEARAVSELRGAGMTVIEPDVAAWSAPVLAKVPAQFESRWGRGAFDALKAL